MDPDVAFNVMIRAGWPRRLAVMSIPLKIDWSLLSGEILRFYWCGLYRTFFVRDGEVYCGDCKVCDWGGCATEITNQIKEYLWIILLANELSLKK